MLMAAASFLWVACMSSYARIAIFISVYACGICLCGLVNGFVVVHKQWSGHPAMAMPMQENPRTTTHNISLEIAYIPLSLAGVVFSTKTFDRTLLHIYIYVYMGLNINAG